MGTLSPFPFSFTDHSIDEHKAKVKLSKIAKIAEKLGELPNWPATPWDAGKYTVGRVSGRDSFVHHYPRLHTFYSPR
jgi:hypothetical protein